MMVHLVFQDFYNLDLVHGQSGGKKRQREAERVQTEGEGAGETRSE